MRATDYIVKRGQPLLLKHYRRIYADQFRAVSTAVPVPIEKAAGGAGLTDFMASQLSELERRAGSHIRGIADSQREAITMKTMSMVNEGKNNSQIARAIGDIAPQIGRTRAATIARTETHTSALKAIDETIRAKKKLKIATKTWWANLDSRVRETHADAHEQVKPADEPFEVGDSELMFPGDDSLGADEGEIINCRCSVLYETSDEDEETGEGVITEEEEEDEDEEWPDKLEVEQKWHDEGFDTAPKYIEDIIERTPPVSDVNANPHPKTGKLTAYQQPTDQSIAMGKYTPDSASGRVVWRHEYGHHVDNQEGRRMGFGQYGYWSKTMKDEQAADEKRLLKIKPDSESDVFRMTYKARDQFDKLIDDGTMTRPAAIHKVLTDILPTKQFTPDDLLMFASHRGEGDVEYIIRAAVRIRAGRVDEAITYLRRLDNDTKKSEIAGAMSDYLGALTRDKIGKGHGAAYYNDTDKFNTDPARFLNTYQGTEMVANYFAIKGTKDPMAKAAEKFIKMYAPKTWAAIHKRMREIAKRAPEKKVKP